MTSSSAIKRDKLGRIVGKPRVSKRCLICDVKFYVAFAREKTAKFCSRRCFSESKKGVDLPQFIHEKGIRSNTGRTHFKKGQKPWNSADSENYQAIHKWLERNKKKKGQCSFCGTSKPSIFHWANLSGDYHRDENDYLELCLSCHCRLDSVQEKVWKVRRKRL